MSNDNENLSDHSDNSMPVLDTEFDGQLPVFTELEEAKVPELVPKLKPPVFALVPML